MTGQTRKLIETIMDRKKNWIGHIMREDTIQVVVVVVSLFETSHLYNTLNIIHDRLPEKRLASYQRWSPIYVAINSNI